MGDTSHGAWDNDIALYRYQAEHCRRHAEESSLSPIDKESWMRLAEDWTKMAQEVERRAEHKDTSTGGEVSERRRIKENPERSQIILRAYKLWERAGRPEGRAEEFYYLAEQQLRDEEADLSRTPDDL